MKRRRIKLWSLARLHTECPAATAVWMALDEMRTAKGSAMLTPTREDIAAATGIGRLRTISTALTTLDSAGWIERHTVTRPGRAGGVVKLMRIIVSRKGQNSTHTGARSVRVKNRPISKGQNSTHDFPYGKGAAEPQPRPLGGRAAAANHPPISEAARLEREHRERIERELAQPTVNGGTQ
jgi:hypothetical protein